MELIIASFLGTIAGIFVGLLPGFGMSVCLLLFSPLLIQQSLIFSLLFYCCASSASQYFGSITTFAFKIPGESTSFPLLELMKNNDFLKKIGDAYFLTSFGSLFASIFSGILIIVFYPYLSLFTGYLKTYVVFFFCILGFILCVLFSENKIHISLFLFLFGWITGKVGFDQIHNSNFLTFDNVYLYGGIPTLPVIMGIYAIPSLYKMFLYSKNMQQTKNQIILSETKLSLIMNNYKTMIVSSFVGFIMGLIPYMGNATSSYVSYFLDKKINKNNYISNAIASETANNSANLSVLIPLVFLGIAIIPSEFLLLEILPLGNKTMNLIEIKSYFIIIFFLLLVSNILCFYASWNFILPLINMMKTFNILVPLLLFFGVTFAVLYIGYDYSQFVYYLITLLLFSIIGICFHKKDMLPFIYAFFLQNHFESILYRFMTLYI